MAKVATMSHIYPPAYAFADAYNIQAQARSENIGLNASNDVKQCLPAALVPSSSYANNLFCCVNMLGTTQAAGKPDKKQPAIGISKVEDVTDTHQAARQRQRAAIIAQQDPMDLPVLEAASQHYRGDSDSTSSSSDKNNILSHLHQMRRHPHDLQLQTSSLHALWVLSYDAENARTIGEVGGIPVLLEVLQYHLLSHLSINSRYNRGNHTNSPSVLRQMALQCNGLATLQNLSLNPTNRDMLMSYNSGTVIANCDGVGSGCEFVQLVLLSMSTFAQNAEIQSSAINSLTNIMSNRSSSGPRFDYKFQILAKGGYQAVLKAIELHKTNEALLRFGYKCLCLMGNANTPMPSWKDFSSSIDRGDVTDLEEESNHYLNNSSHPSVAGDGFFDADVSARSAQSGYY